MARFSLLVALMLTGCAAAPPYVAACPPLVTYSPEFQHQAADQLAALSPGSPIAKMMSDYIGLRQAVRECAR